MSRRERGRLEIMGRVRRGEITVAKAAELLEVSYRQAKRIWARYSEEGDRGLVHRLRGKASNRRTDARYQRRVLKRYEAQYADYGPTLACECLAEDGLKVAVETLRQWLLGAGLWQRRRRSRPHRLRRPRKEYRGELVQMDGSHHDWFEGRRDWAVLMVMIDDATSEVYARFFEGETTAACMEIFRRYARRHGLPRALYVDRDSIYRCDQEPTREEVLAGKLPRTQFGRAMEGLGVDVILAGSPQAKGRVERCHGTFQDRLVKALRRERISDLDQANEFLEKKFLPQFNRRFSRPPAKPSNLHCRLPRDVDLNLILSFQEQRQVQNDWTIRWQNRWFQLTSANQKLGLVGKRITICQQLDGRIRLRYGKRELPFVEIVAQPMKPSDLPTKEIHSSQGQRPPADHPWRKGFGRRGPWPRRPGGGPAPLRLATLASAEPAHPLRF
jgi:hypothetical protein